jgi:hypothetical protein
MGSIRSLDRQEIRFAGLNICRLMNSGRHVQGSLVGTSHQSESTNRRSSSGRYWVADRRHQPLNSPKWVIWPKVEDAPAIYSLSSRQDESGAAQMKSAGREDR